MMFVVGSSSAAAIASTANQDVSAASNVAKNAAGKMKSTVSGKTAGGGTLGGTFTPLKFKNKDGVARRSRASSTAWLLTQNGAKSKFTAIRTLDVKKVNGQKLSGLAGGCAERCSWLRATFSTWCLARLT